MHADASSALAILALALLLDWTIGEYPSFFHPVVWMGRATSAGLRLAPASGWWRQFLFGAVLTLLAVSVSAGLAWIVLQALAAHYLVAYVLVAGILLKSSFALRELGRAALAVVRHLEKGDRESARLAVRSLCSRDPSTLTEEELLAGTVESLAENASDSFVAPLFYYVLLGVPGAIGYRAINTLDAMIGYRGRFEALGKFAARLDDVANWIPARLTAFLFLVVGRLFGGDAAHGWRMLRRDGGKTPSPNGGRPMAAMAGLLGVRLDKAGVYSLGDARHVLTGEVARRAWHVVAVAGLSWVIACGLALGTRYSCGV
jgi:adenosylcobinamide-phosphate synthase